MALIDRDAVIKMTWKDPTYTDPLNVLAEVRDRIEALPTVEPMQWIPCSEQLPGDDEEVIVTIYDDSGDTPFSYATVGWHYKGLWVVGSERCSRVMAWMPFPEPYKGGDADGKR